MQSRPASLAALIGVVLIGMTGFGVFLPIFPFLALELGATPSATTIAMGAYSFGQLISSPFWGRLSDRVGRKPILIAGLIGGVISYLWLARAASVEELGAARFFGGLMAGNVGAAFAAAADLADDKTRARNMGLLGAAVGLGFIAGPALGALLIGETESRESFAFVCYVSAALAGLAALAALALFRESLPPEARRKAGETRVSRAALLFSRPALMRFVIVMFLVIAAQAMMETVFGLWADAQLQFRAREVGWTLAGLGFGGMGVAREAAALIAALTALVIGIGLATPALNALIASQAGEQERGAVMGLSQSASALGRVAGPLASGPLFEAITPGAPFIAASVLILVALFVALREPAREAGQG